MRAGKVLVGTDTVCSAMAKTKKPCLVLIAHTASEATKKKLLTKAEFYGVETVIIDVDSDELGRRLGKLYAPATVAVVDDRFANEIRLALAKAEGDTDGIN